jgi:tRNA (guanine37-N1)-methyltransferase
VLASEACFIGESHWDGLLEHPQYSRPEVWRGRTVPQVLLSGHHGNIAAWRRAQSEQRTRERRPDLWENKNRRTEDGKPGEDHGGL